MKDIEIYNFIYKGGEDFTDISEILMFDPTEAPRVCSAVMIFSDDILEEVEVFNVTLSNPVQDNSLIITEPDATVAIIDTSCKYYTTISLTTNKYKIHDFAFIFSYNLYSGATCVHHF